MPADPLFINNAAGSPAYAANELRRAFAMLLTQAVADKFGARSGVHPAGGNAVSLSGTTVTVLNTKAVVYPGLTSLAGPYIVQLPSRTHALNAADGSNPRKDIIVMRVWDNDEDALGLRQADTVYVVGTPAASPSEPAVPASSFKLATIDVPAGGSPAPSLTFNAPYTVATGGVLPVRTDAELPGSSSGLYDGMVRWNRATDQLQVHNGATTWETVADLALKPGTLVAVLQRTTAVSLTNTSSSASSTAIPWNLETLDKLNCYSTGTNPTRYQPNVAGWYVFDGSVSMTAATGGTVRGTAWRKNGAAFDGNVSRSHVFPTGTGPGVTVTCNADTMPLAMNGTTDYVELAGLQDSGGALDTATGGFNPSFLAVYAGPL